MNSFKTRPDEIVSQNPADIQVLLKKILRGARTDFDTLKEALWVIKNNKCDVNFIKAKPLAATPNSKLSLGYGRIWIGDVFADASETWLTLDIAASGALGLDTGSEAVSTWYYVYLIAKSSGDISAIFSTSSTAPTLPAGYDHYRLASAVYNDSSGNFVNFRQLRDIYLYVSAQTAVAITAPMAGATLVNAEQWLPDFVREVFFTAYTYDVLSGGVVRPITRAYSRLWGTSTANTHYYANPTTGTGLSGRNNIFGSLYTDDRSFAVYMYEDTGSTPTSYDGKFYILGFRFDF